MQQFSARVIQWQRRHGRRRLPWQNTRDPYKVWLSEIMLQQTQVAAVVPYYVRFLGRFPTVDALAAAPQEEVLRLWSGLGYYARARNLHAAARAVAVLGRFPDSAREIATLPGVGRSTAAAIAAFAFGERAAILDGNVKRVLARAYGIEGWPGDRAVEKHLWALAERLLPARGIASYTQGLMDLGATVCHKRNPRCTRCPIQRACVARARGLLAEIPAPRPNKPLPVKRATWLVLVRSGKVLLEKRPSRGVWGGLWAFPEKRRCTIAAQCRSLGYQVAGVTRLPALEHGFTHFRLKIQPVLCKVAKPDTSSKDGAVTTWMPLGEAGEAAIPSPVRSLIERLNA
ncbi:MAG TPA: A/G-specific adenine glycosylase [Burkholderiales bacterium]